MGKPASQLFSLTARSRARLQHRIEHSKIIKSSKQVSIVEVESFLAFIQGLADLCIFNLENLAHANAVLPTLYSIMPEAAVADRDSMKRLLLEVIKSTGSPCDAEAFQNIIHKQDPMRGTEAGNAMSHYMSQLIYAMLHFASDERPQVQELLDHPFFAF